MSVGILVAGKRKSSRQFDRTFSQPTGLLRVCFVSSNVTGVARIARRLRDRPTMTTRAVSAIGRPDLAGRRPGWALTRQHLHREPMAIAKERMRLPIRLRDRAASPRRAAGLDRILPPLLTTRCPWRTATKRGLPARHDYNAIRSENPRGRLNDARSCPRIRWNLIYLSIERPETFGPILRPAVEPGLRQRCGNRGLIGGGAAGK